MGKNREEVKLSIADGGSKTEENGSRIEEEGKRRERSKEKVNMRRLNINS